MANNFIGDVKVTKIRLTEGKSQFFVVYGIDKSGNIIRFSVDEFNFSPGDTIHLDIKNKVIYPIKDSSNIVHPEVWNRDNKDWEETKPIKSHKMI